MWKSNVAAHLHAIDATPARRRGGVDAHATHWLISTQVKMMEAELDDVITDSDESYYSGHSEDECTIDPLGETAAFQDLRRQAKADALRRAQEGREREEEKFWDQDDDRVPESNDGDLGLQLTAREPVMMKLSECLNEVPPTPRLKKPGRVSPDAPRKTPDSRPPKSPVVFEARPPSRCPPPNFGEEPKKSMLGDLPALGNKKKKKRKKKKASKKELEAFMSLELEVPLQQLHAKNAAAGERQRRLGYINDGKTVSSPTTGKNMEDGRVPKHLCCCINGHLMRDPVFCAKFPAKDKVAYERETIELWLKTRGSVCPITGRNLKLEDLEPDTQLRNEIVRFQVQRTMAAADPFDALNDEKASGGDDLYDF